MNASVAQSFLRNRLESFSGKLLITFGLVVALVLLRGVDMLFGRVFASHKGTIIGLVMLVLCGTFLLVVIAHRVLNLDIGWRRLAIVAGAVCGPAFIFVHPFGPLSVGLYEIVFHLSIGAGFGAAAILLIVWVKEGFESHQGGDEVAHSTPLPNER